MRKFAFALLLSAMPAFGQAPFCSHVQALVEPSPAHWGISVTTLDGQSLCQVNAAQLFRPASNAKLFTTAAALALLGPATVFKTTVTGELDPATGVVTGDLSLVGGGDANLDSGDLPYVHSSEPRPPLAFHDLEDLANQLVAKRVKRVTGDIVGDDTVFAYQPYAASWELDDLVYGFGAPVTALSLADNQLHLTITPGIPGSRAGVILDQGGNSYYIVESQISTVASKSASTGYAIERVAGTHTLRLTGTVAAGARPITEEIAIDDPASFAATALRSVLIAHGIVVSGVAKADHRIPDAGPGFLTQLKAPGGLEDNVVSPKDGYSGGCAMPGYGPTLATHTSPSIAADILFTNKVSQNLHAELLLHRLGSILSCRDGSTVSGARMVRAFLLHAGISPDDFVFYDGSGLSGHDLVTPRAVTQLLTYAAKQAWFPAYKASLPVGGVDGSLANRFSGPLKGKVFAKTGTLGESRALSGFVTATSGQTLVFSILDDNHPPDSSADRALMDHLVELIAASN